MKLKRAMRLTDLCRAINARLERERIGLLRGIVAFIVLETLWELAARPWPVVQQTITDTRAYRTIQIPTRVADKARRLYRVAIRPSEYDGLDPLARWHAGHSAALRRLRAGASARLAELDQDDPARPSVLREREALDLAISYLAE